MKVESDFYYLFLPNLFKFNVSSKKSKIFLKNCYYILVTLQDLLNDRLKWSTLYTLACLQ